jgi:hypothetical protein
VRSSYLSRLSFLAAALIVALAGTLLAKQVLAGGIGNQRLLDQLGVRLATTPPANPKVGSTFEGVVVDPAKLSAKGFPGIKRNDKVLLKITGPNNEFAIRQGGTPLERRFKFNAQGIIGPNTLPTKIAPAAAPAVKQ